MVVCIKGHALIHTPVIIQQLCSDYMLTTIFSSSKSSIPYMHTDNHIYTKINVISHNKYDDFGYNCHVMHEYNDLNYKVNLYTVKILVYNVCLLYTSPSPRDATLSRMPSSA